MSRLELHEELCSILGSRNVYFQPPESVKLAYPCIVYYRSGVDKRNANNRVYAKTNRYEITVIDKNPDIEIADKLMDHFPMCSFDRRFTSDNLNHSILTLYY